MPGITASRQFSKNSSLSVEQLFSAAFHNIGRPRSAAYVAGVRAALSFRVEGVAIVPPYTPGSARSDAFAAGRAEGDAIWNAAFKSTDIESLALVACTPCIELNDQEILWAQDFFAEVRQIDQVYYEGLLPTLKRMGRDLAAKHPRRKQTKLSLIVGGAG